MQFKLICSLAIVFILFAQQAVAQTKAGEVAPSDSSGVTLYDADPGHLWNRLYAAIFLRVDAGGNIYGPESLDILLWTETKHLIAGPSHDIALKVLDEFIASHGEKLIDSPLKRAVMQRDLWAAYNWTVRMEEIYGKNPAIAATVREIQSRLVVVIKSIALSKEQIETLPDNYSSAVCSGKFAVAPDPAHPGTPFLPPALFEPESPWVCLGGRNDYPLASQHAGGCSFHSAFFTFVKLPEGRAALSAYLEVIKKSVLYIPDPDTPKSHVVSNRVKRNPAMPQISEGTMVALVRQMILIDTEGRPVATHLTESVQLRVYRSIMEDRIMEDREDFNEVHAQLVYEFLMDRKQLFANLSGGLRAAGSDHRSFIFGPRLICRAMIHLILQIPSPPPPHSLQSCMMCHRAPGVFSILSINNLFGDKIQTNLIGDIIQTRLHSLRVSTPESEKEIMLRKKERFRLDGHH